MGNILFLHAVGLTSYALEETIPDNGKKGGKTSAFAQLTGKIFQLPEVDRAVVLTDLPADKLQPHWTDEWGPVISKADWTVESLLRQLQKDSEGYDNLYYVWADAPLMDVELSAGMYRNHRRFFADYTFADGYPRGLTPQIINPAALSQLIELSQRHEIKAGRDYLFEVLQKDINAFDLETEIAPTDQRMLRVWLTADTRRNTEQLRRIVEAGGRDAASVQKVLEERPELLRTYPAYVNVQITGGCPQSCSYCPYPSFGGDILNRRDEMSLENWESLLDQVRDYCGDAMIGISAWGEPALHSRIAEIIAAVFERPGLSLTVETSGVGWSVPVLRKIAEQYKAGTGGTAEAGASASGLSWIVSLDSDEQQMYEQLRGPQMDEALAAVDLLRELFPGQVFVQAVRMKTNEDQLDRFYRRWKKKDGVEVIVQKYDSFCGELPERKVTDLSPIDRFPCWHLKRDIIVLIDGSVPMCREDIKGEYIMGNVFSENLKDVWERGAPYYLRHLKSDYPQLCGNCDEYYTYNF